MNRNEIVYVNIHGNPVPTILHNGKPHVGMKALCEQMGLQWEAQLKRIKRDENLSQGMSMMDIPSNGGTQEMVCLPLDMINGWLLGYAKPENAITRHCKHQTTTPKQGGGFITLINEEAAQTLTAADSATYTETLS